MTIDQFARLIYDSEWVRYIGALLAANVLLGLAAALFSRRYEFYLAATADFLLSRAVPYLLGWGAVKLVALTAFGSYAGAASATEAVVSGLVIAALVGKILNILAALFPNAPIPAWATDKPKPEAKAVP